MALSGDSEVAISDPGLVLQTSMNEEQTAIFDDLKQKLTEISSDEAINPTTKVLLEAAIIAQTGNYVGVADYLLQTASPELGYAFADLVNAALGYNAVNVTRAEGYERKSPPEVRYDRSPAQIFAIDGIDNAGKTTLISLIQRMLVSRYQIPGLKILSDSKEPWKGQLEFAVSNGSGLSHQSERGNVISARQPGGTMIGKEIRKVLLETPGLSEKLDPFVYTLLYYADRTQLYGELDDYLKSYPDSIVLLDRCSLSTLVFQVRDFRQKCIKEGLRGDELQSRVEQFRNKIEVFDASFGSWNRESFGRFFPEVTVLLDGDPEELAFRVSKCSSRNYQNWRDNGTLESQQELRESYLRLIAMRQGYVCDAHASILANALGIVDLISKRIGDYLNVEHDITENLWFLGISILGFSRQVDYMVKRLQGKFKGLKSLDIIQSEVKVEEIRCGIQEDHLIPPAQLSEELLINLGFKQRSDYSLIERLHLDREP